MKLKGQSIKVNKKQYVLKDLLGEGGFSMIYQTNHPQIICKVQVLASKQIAKAYNKQKQILQLVAHPNIVKLHDHFQLTTKQEKYGLLFMEKCSNGTVFTVLQKSQGTSLNEKIILKILASVADLLQNMHKKGIAHRDIKMENILINSQGQYKVCDFGSCSSATITKIDSSNRDQIQEYIQKTTTPFYRAPEQLDLYSGYEIGFKVDIFALGVLGFIMSFQKPPFQSRLSAINTQYFLPQGHSYSPEFISILQKCFTPNPKFRPSATQIKYQIAQVLKLKRMQINLPFNSQFDQTMNEISRINDKNLTKNTAVAQTGIFDKLKRIINQMTTETQGWIAGFVQDNQQAPTLQYNRSIISKCYQKRYKVQKVYQLIQKFSQQYKNKSLVTIKLLILLHNFLRKGPKESIVFEKQHSPINFCIKIYKHWKSCRPIDQQDIKRNSFICLLIRSYSLILIYKVKLCYQNSHLIQGNYSIVPYLQNAKENTILKINFINSMIQFLDKCLSFHQHLQKIDYLPLIQNSIIFSLIDEEYCLVSTLVFVFVGFKLAACHVKEEIDFNSLQIMISQSQKQFERVYRKMVGLIEKNKKNSNFTGNFNINLDLEVINYIKKLKLEKKPGQFNIADHLSYKNSIYGLKIPLTYEEVVKNPNFLKNLQQMQSNNSKIIQINQFKIKKQNKQEVKKEQKIPSKVQSKIQSKKVQQTKTSFPTINQSNKVNKQQTQKKFTKPKQQKDKIFQNFFFQQQKEINKIKKNNNNLMQFTHQNLNKDFMTIDNPNDKKQTDQFKDFLSIVDNKVQKQNKKGLQKNSNDINHVSASSKEVFASENKNQINKIQLMNFFFDQDSYKSVDKTQQNKVTLNSNKQKTDLIDFSKVEAQQIKQIKKQSPKKPNQINLIQIQAQILQPKENNANNINVQVKKSPSKQTNLIDLKEFVVEEVRKNADQYIIDYNTLIFKERIGYGNSSEVFRGQWRGRQVAIKRIKDNVNSVKSSKEFKREIMTSVKIRHHPQLVTLIGVCQYQKYFYIINEYCNGSTLFDLLHEENDPIPWNTRISIAKQIAKGMIFLHTNDPPIIHRDLKSLNILLVNKYDLNNPDIAQIKVADFGLSRDYASTYMTGTLGTYHWMAPEIFNNESYTLKADVYSYGIVLWQIASRMPPYTDMKNPQSLMKYVTMENGRPDLKLVDKDCPFELKMLMMRCWDKFPSNRPNFNEILASLQCIFYYEVKLLQCYISFLAKLTKLAPTYNLIIALCLAIQEFFYLLHHFKM